MTSSLRSGVFFVFIAPTVITYGSFPGAVIVPYPFVPAAGGAGAGAERTGGERSTERELQLKAQMADELPIEPELERWFPLWGIPI